MFSALIVLPFGVTCSAEALLKMCFGLREPINALGIKKKLK